MDEGRRAHPIHGPGDIRHAGHATDPFAHALEVRPQVEYLLRRRIDMDAECVVSHVRSIFTPPAQNRYRRRMYQPAHRKFEVEDPAALLTELCAVVPATLVTHGLEGFRASILPMLFDPDDGPHGMLRGHLARGNLQWREIEAAIDAGGDGAGEAL